MIDGTRFCVCFASHSSHALVGRFTWCATSQSQQRTFHTFFLAMIEVPMIPALQSPFSRSLFSLAPATKVNFQ